MCILLLDSLLAVLYGVLEGITEWLPISSTGHLILLRHFLPHTLNDAFFELFEVVIQLGAMLAVLALFWKKLNPFQRDAQKRRATLLLWGKIAVAVLPAAAVGFFWDDLIEAWLFTPLTVAITLIVYGVFFLLPERRRKLPCVTETSAVTWRMALGIGCFQVLALIPGTSRSGATIMGGMLLGASRAVGAEFSFFLGLPTMAGAGILKTVKFFGDGGTLATSEWVFLALGTLTAFLVSLVVIRFLMDFVRRHSFAAFGIYRILLGIAVLLTIL